MNKAKDYVIDIGIILVLFVCTTFIVNGLFELLPKEREKKKALIVDSSFYNQHGYNVIEFRNNIIDLLIKKELFSEASKKIKTDPDIHGSYYDILTRLYLHNYIDSTESKHILDKAKNAGGYKTNGYNLLAMGVHILQVLYDKNYISKVEGQQAIDKAKY